MLRMKSAVVIILIIFCASIFFPAMLVSAAPDSNGPCIRGLNICHGKITGAAPELPYIAACICRLFPPVHTVSAGQAQIPVRHFLIAFQEDHPPKT